MLRAILIDCIVPSTSPEEAKNRMTEAQSLITTYGGVVLVKKIQKKLTPNYKTYLSNAKIEEIIEENQQLKANIVIVNNELKPRQTHNLNELLRKNELQAWDRIDLILKIFQKHAKTREAKLEIELASIRHMGPRIFGMGMELSRQGGGIGTKGVGETNIEFMKRHLSKIEQRIKQELEECKKVRKLHRSGRKRRNLPTVGIIGYTNAGKTSLLNALTHKGAYAANKLFATLDTRVGKMLLKPNSKPFPDGTPTPYQPPQEILISDTIGFIRDLPPMLIKSFQSTLEETKEADLLLHVIDASDPKMEQKIQTVNEILAQIDALQKPTIFVLNKTDKASDKKLVSLKKQLSEKQVCLISSLTGKGIPQLKKTIAAAFLPPAAPKPAAHSQGIGIGTR